MRCSARRGKPSIARRRRNRRRRAGTAQAEPTGFIAKTERELAAMRRSGQILASALEEVQAAIRPGVTGLELDALVTAVIRAAGAEPSFLGYAPYGPDNPFPGAICYSVNEMVVHGIPDSRPLDCGDVVTVDVGVDYQGLKTDAAWTWAVGEISEPVQRLLDATRQALDDAISICGPGVGVEAIATRIEKTVRGAGFVPVAALGGHGVGHQIWEPPHIPNRAFGAPSDQLAANSTFCIEPIVSAGGDQCRTAPDGWGVLTTDGSWAAHFEHTLALTANGLEILTQFRAVP